MLHGKNYFIKVDDELRSVYTLRKEAGGRAENTSVSFDWAVAGG